MKVAKVRVPEGRAVFVREVELFTVEEARAILSGKDWEIGGDVYDVSRPNRRVGWLAAFPNGDGIYVEAKGVSYDN